MVQMDITSTHTVSFRNLDNITRITRNMFCLFVCFFLPKDYILICRSAYSQPKHHSNTLPAVVDSHVMVIQTKISEINYNEYKIINIIQSDQHVKEQATDQTKRNNKHPWQESLMSSANGCLWDGSRHMKWCDVEISYNSSCDRLLTKTLLCVMRCL